MHQLTRSKYENSGCVKGGLRGYRPLSEGENLFFSEIFPFTVTINSILAPLSEESARCRKIPGVPPV